MKPKIRQLHRGIYTCRGYGKTGHGPTAWKAYSRCRLFAFKPELTSILTCEDCSGCGEKRIPYSKNVTCKACKGLGCVVPEKTIINSIKCGSGDMFKFSLSLILGTLLTSGLIYLIIGLMN